MGAAAWDEDIWVTRLIDWLCERTINRPLLVGALSIGMVPVVLSAIFFALTWDETTPRYVVSHMLVIAIGVVGPGLIWYWDRVVFQRFVDDVASLTQQTDELEALAEQYSRLFRKRFWVFSALLVGFFLVVAVSNVDFYRSIGVAGMTDPAFLALLAGGIAWGFLVGIGFHMAIVAVAFIRAVGRLELQIEPLHPDGLGGLSAIGTFAIWTTMFISIGSLGFPYVFLLTAEGSAAPVIYAAVAFYVLVIALSFLYPTVYVNRRAQAVRERELDRMRKRIRALEETARDPAEHGSTDEVAKRLEIRRLREEFRDYSQVSLYPLSIGIITRLLTSIFLPILFIVFEMWFSSMV